MKCNVMKIIFWIIAWITMGKCIAVVPCIIVLLPDLLDKGICLFLRGHRDCIADES